jgi:hypothetical protein
MMGVYLQTEGLRPTDVPLLPVPMTVLMVLANRMFALGYHQ